MTDLPTSWRSYCQEWLTQSLTTRTDRLVTRCLSRWLAASFSDMYFSVFGSKEGMQADGKSLLTSRVRMHNSD